MPWWQRDRNPLKHRQTLRNVSLPDQQQDGNGEAKKTRSISAMAKAFLVTGRRLRLDPDRKLFFLYEPGKQVSSALKIKNISRSHVAFKFQTNAPKSCFMRPPSGVLSPGETIMVTVVKFVEQPENGNQERRSKDKFKIVSLKVKQGIDYTPELFDDEKDLVVVERILRVVFLDPRGQSPEIEKLKKRLAEAEAAFQAQKKQPEDKTKKTAMAGGVLDEWKEQQKEKRLIKSEDQADGADTL